MAPTANGDAPEGANTMFATVGGQFESRFLLVLESRTSAPKSLKILLLKNHKTVILYETRNAWRRLKILGNRK